MNKNRLRRLAAALCTLFLLFGILPDAYAAQVADAADSLSYTVTPGGTAALNAADFRAFFYARCQNDTFRYVAFQSDASLKVSNGILYSAYGTEDVDETTYIVRTLTIDDYGAALGLGDISLNVGDTIE